MGKKRFFNIKQSNGLCADLMGGGGEGGRGANLSKSDFKPSQQNSNFTMWRKKKVQGKVSCDLAKLIFMATSAQHISTSLLEEWVVIIGHRAGWATVYRPCTLGLGFKLHLRPCALGLGFKLHLGPN